MSGSHPLNRRVVVGVGAVLLAGSAITAASYLAARASDHRAATEGVRRRADLTAQVVQGEILRYQETLTELAVALSSHQDLQRSNFDAITQPLINSRLTAASGVTFLVPGTSKQTPSIQAYWRRRGATRLSLAPAGSQPRHVYVVFSRPLDGVPTLLGRDVSQSPELEQTLALVRATGKLAVSEPYVLAKDQERAFGQRQLSLALAAPVSDPSGNARGWVVMGLRSGDLLGKTLDATGQGAINATFTTSLPSGKPLTLATHVSGHPGDASLIRRVTIPIGQHQWILTMQGTDAAARQDAADEILPRGVLAGGPVITLLLAGLIFLLATSRQRALLAVERSSADVREADERFRLAFEQAHTGMAIVDMRPAGRGTFLRVNDALCETLGYASQDLLKRTFSELTHPDERERDLAVMADLVEGKRDTAEIEKRYLHADGHVIWVKVSIAVIDAPDGRPTYAVSQFENITERRAETERLSAMALQDPLTGLGNRLLFDDRMAQAAARAARTHRPVGVIFCDLDLFKVVNDTHGHAAGDAVLRAVAARIRDTVRPADTVARLGGDEFAVLCEDLDSPGGCEHVSDRLQGALDQPIDLPSGAAIRVRCSLGHATADARYEHIDIPRLLHEADIAMYRSKNAAGRRTIANPL
jgi:diguanylate cyclase (GGDEF)-like protein/PAS domain S-box-containing protein